MSIDRKTYGTTTHEKVGVAGRRGGGNHRTRKWTSWSRCRSDGTIWHRQTIITNDKNTHSTKEVNEDSETQPFELNVKEDKRTSAPTVQQIDGQWPREREGWDVIDRTAETATQKQMKWERLYRIRSEIRNNNVNGGKVTVKQYHRADWSQNLTRWNDAYYWRIVQFIFKNNAVSLPEHFLDHFQLRLWMAAAKKTTAGNSREDD